MSIKHLQPIADERAFADEPSKHLSAYGTTASAYSILDDQLQRQSYGLVFRF
jgi:hypothetical protein